MRANLSCTEILHLRHRFFKFSASKTPQISAQNSPTARVRRCASQTVALETALVFISSCAASKNAQNHLKTEFLRLRRRFFKFSAPTTRQNFAETFKNRTRPALRTSSDRICAFCLSCAACQNASKAACNRFFACAPSSFQTFGVKNAAIFRAKFADRAHSALRIPKYYYRI